MRAQRELWLELDGAKAVLLRRPLEVELPKMRQAAGLAEFAIAAVVDWRNFTEADLVGSSDGSDAVVDFDADLWAEWARDNTVQLNVVIEKLMQIVTQHFERRGNAAKN